MNKTLREKYEENYLGNDFIISIVTISVFVIISYWTGFNTSLEKTIEINSEALYTSVASISGAILGFIIASITIIFAFIRDDKLKIVRNSDSSLDIYKTYISSIKHLGFTMLFSITAILINSDPINLPIFFIVTWAVLISTLRVGRCVWILDNLVRILNIKNSKT